MLIKIKETHRCAGSSMHGVTIDLPISDMPYTWTSWRMIQYPYKLYPQLAKAKGSEFIGIKYCPFCGEKLEPEMYYNGDGERSNTDE